MGVGYGVGGRVGMMWNGGKLNKLEGFKQKGREKEGEM